MVVLTSSTTNWNYVDWIRTPICDRDWKPFYVVWGGQEIQRPENHRKIDEDNLIQRNGAHAIRKSNPSRECIIKTTDGSCESLTSSILNASASPNHFSGDPMTVDRSWKVVHIHTDFEGCAVRSWTQAVTVTHLRCRDVTHDHSSLILTKSPIDTQSTVDSGHSFLWTDWKANEGVSSNVRTFVNQVVLNSERSFNGGMIYWRERAFGAIPRAVPRAIVWYDSYPRRASRLTLNGDFSFTLRRVLIPSLEYSPK